MSNDKEDTVTIYGSNIHEYFSLSEGVLDPPEKRSSERLSYLFYLPAGIHTIGDSCFKEYDEIESLTLAKDAVSLGETITGRCVKDVKLGKNVREIHPKAFGASPELSGIGVRSGNPFYSSMYGMLMSKDGSRLVFAPQNSTGRALVETLEREAEYENNAKGNANALIGKQLKKKIRKAFKDLTSIGDFAFGIFPEEYRDTFKDYYVGWTLDLKWPEGLREIGSYAFRGCYYYKSISFCEGLKKIGTGAFINCKKLEEIILPQSVEDIGSYAFYLCDRLRRLVLPDPLAFVSKGLCKDCIGLSEVVLPSSCTCIEDEAFSGCTSLESIAVPDTVKTIGSKAFYGCGKLDIVVPASAECCEDSFTGCRSVVFR